MGNVESTHELFMIITTATIIPPNWRDTASPSAGANRTGKTQIAGTFEDGTRKFVLGFYDDELRFRKEEVIGLTQEEVDDLFLRKDKAYLQS